jgi:hypothetical protein
VGRYPSIKRLPGRYGIVQAEMGKAKKAMRAGVLSPAGCNASHRLGDQFRAATAAVELRRRSRRRFTLKKTGSNIPSEIGFSV